MPHDGSRKSDWAYLRLTDRLEPGIRVLLVGINPGVRSAQTGHHFAGPSNRFWKLLYDSGLVSEPITHLDDARLPEWGMGITNLVARPSPGINDLKPSEYIEGWKTLEEKIGRYRPEIVAFVGVTLYRALWNVLGPVESGRKGLTQSPVKGRPGFPRATVHGARVFVLPNPSGRNANFSYKEMLDAFRTLRRAIRRLPAQKTTARPARPRVPLDLSAPQPPTPPLEDASSEGSAGSAPGTRSRAAGTTSRTTPSTPADSPSRKASRTRAG